MGKKKKETRGRPITTGTTPMRCIRVPDDEWELWQDVAEANGVTVTALVRQAVNQAIKPQKRSKG